MEEPIELPPPPNSKPVLVSAIAGTDVVQLMWTNESDPEGAANHTGKQGKYDIIIDNVDTQTTWRGNVTNKRITGLNEGQRYCFKVQARYTDVPEYLNGNEICVTTLGTPPPEPEPPTKLERIQIKINEIQVILDEAQGTKLERIEMKINEIQSILSEN